MWHVKNNNPKQDLKCGHLGRSNDTKNDSNLVLSMRHLKILCVIIKAAHPFALLLARPIPISFLWIRVGILELDVRISICISVGVMVRVVPLLRIRVRDIGIRC